MIKNILIGGLAVVLVVVVWMNARTTVVSTQNNKVNTEGKDVDTVTTSSDVPLSEQKVTGLILDISNKGLTTVSQDIFKQTDVTSLDVSNNELGGALPAEVRMLTKLSTLNLSNNNFTGVPAEIGQLTQLRVLDLSNNPITGLPHEIGNLQKLEKFDVSGTNYSKADLKIIREKLPTTTVIVTD